MKKSIVMFLFLVLGISFQMEANTDLVLDSDGVEMVAPLQVTTDVVLDVAVNPPIYIRVRAPSVKFLNTTRNETLETPNNIIIKRFLQTPEIRCRTDDYIRSLEKIINKNN